MVQYPSREERIRHCPSGDLQSHESTVTERHIPHVPSHVSEFVIMKLRQKADRSGLLRIMDGDSIHSGDSKKHPVWQSEHRARTSSRG
jgi:hypothetical protein